MGANEKYEAAMYGGEYVPNTDEVRSIYSQHRNVTYADFTQYRAAEFDRWLATVRAEAKAEALEEAIDALMAGPEANLNPDGTIRPPHLHRSPRLNHKPRLRVANWLLRRANQYKETSNA